MTFFYKNNIKEKYGIESIPMFVLINADTGYVLNANAREDFNKNPNGSKFPWEKHPDPDEPFCCSCI